MYTIKFSNGQHDESTDTYDEAVAAIREIYGEDAVIGHDGDLSDSGDRTLCWADEASSIGDDGKNAVASIYREEIEPA